MSLNFLFFLPQSEDNVNVIVYYVFLLFHFTEQSVSFWILKNTVFLIFHE